MVPRIIHGKVGETNIRFFAHRNEGLGFNLMESKRYFDCRTGMNEGELLAAYNGHQYWKWANLTSTQFIDRSYDEI